MKKVKFLAFALVFGMVSAPYVANAQLSASDSHTVTFDVQDAIEVKIVQGTATATTSPVTDADLADDGDVTDVNFGTLSILSTEADREVLATEPNGAAVRVRSSLPYSMTVASSAATFTWTDTTASGAADPMKPVSDLEFRSSVFDTAYNSYTAMSNSAITVATSQTATDVRYYPVDYRVAIHSTDAAGQYQTTLTYTATTA